MRTSRLGIGAAALFGLVCIALTGGVHKASAEPTRRPRVLVDRSHEWLFAYDDLGDRMLRPVGYDVVLCDATINTTERLQDFDIVVLLQIANAFDYSTAEIALLQEYVRAGGSVIIVGNSELPVSDVAKSFGFRFGQERCELPFVATPRLLTVGGADGDPQTRPMSYVVKPPKGAEMLITDQYRRAIAAMASFGKGKVICFADDGAYWDFCAQRDREMRVPNTETTVALFHRLTPYRPPAGPGGPVRRVTAEQEISLPGVTVRHSAPVAIRAKELLDRIPRVAELVASYNGTKRPTETLVVNILAANGGGYSGGREIGVQCAGEMGANVKVIAHEMTHSWTGPLPGLIGEGWASMVGMRVASDLGFREAARSERNHWQILLDHAETGSRRLELTEPETAPSLFGACEAKMMSLVERLEKSYGRDFMPRFLCITRALKGSENPSLNEVLCYFSLAAGEDLIPLYKRLHVAYIAPQSLITKEELAQKLAAYRSP